MNFILVHWHGVWSLFLVELDRCNAIFDDPVLLLTCSNAWFQVMPSTSSPVRIEQLRVMLESGYTVIKLVCWHTDEEQEDFISHFMSAGVEASVERKQKFDKNILAFQFTIGFLEFHMICRDHSTYGSDWQEGVGRTVPSD